MKTEMLICVNCRKEPQKKGMLTCSRKCSREYQKAYNKAYNKAYYQRKKKEIRGIEE